MPYRAVVPVDIPPMTNDQHEHREHHVRGAERDAVDRHADHVVRAANERIARAPHYSRAVLRLIAFIVFAQKIGYSLDEIAKQLVNLPENTTPTNKDWQRLSRGWSLPEC